MQSCGINHHHPVSQRVMLALVACLQCVHAGSGGVFVRTVLLVGKGVRTLASALACTRKPC
jgi:hypothetical protein